MGFRGTDENEFMTGQSKPGWWRWGVCGLLLLASTINYMDRQTLANASVRITKEFQLTQEQYGDLELAFGWAFAGGSLLFGVLADRMPVRWLYPMALLCWSVMGYLTGSVYTYEGLLWCRGLLGLFEAAHWPCALKTTQHLLESKDRTLGNSVLQSGTSIGAIITPLIMRAMLTEELGSWRPAFQWIAATGVLWIVLWFAAIRASDLPDHSRAAVASTGSGSFWHLLLDRRFAAVLVLVAMINTSWQTLRAWLPKFLMEGRGYAEKAALDFNALYYVATDVGCLAAGALTLALGRRGFGVHRARSITFLMAASLTALALFLPFLGKGPVLLMVLLAIGAGALGLFPCYYAWTQELSRVHQGKVSGLTGVAAWALSAPAQKGFGWLIDETKSFDLGLVVAGLLPLVGFGLFTLLWKEPNARLEPAKAV